MMLVLVLPILFGAAGLAVDYSNMLRIHAQMQDAADAAALAAAKEKDRTEAQRRTIAKQYFEANNPGVTVTAVTVTFGAEKVTVDVEAEVNFFLTGIFGIGQNQVSATSTAQSTSESLEIVFALDVSGSMLNTMSTGRTRLAELKDAVNGLLDKLKAKTTFDIRAAIVPFTMSVNVGTGNGVDVWNTSNPLFAGTSWKGCVFEMPAPQHVLDIPGGKWAAYIWPPMPNVANGDQAYNISDGTLGAFASLAETTAPDLSADYAGPNHNCVRFPIVPLSTDLEAVKTKVNALQSFGNWGTLIAPAVTWSMRVLSPAKPFTEGLAYGPTAKKIIIVVTDGEQVTEAEFFGDGVSNQATNSVTPWQFDPATFGLGGGKVDTGFGPADFLSPYGFIRDSRPFGGTDTSAPSDWETHKDELVALSDSACAEAKKKTGGRDIQIFSIGVSDQTAPGTRAYTALHNCASEPRFHFYVKDKADLDKAFDALLTTLSKLRLSV